MKVEKNRGGLRVLTNSGGGGENTHKNGNYNSESAKSLSGGSFSGSG